MLYKNWNHKQKHIFLFFEVKFSLLKSNEILSLFLSWQSFVLQIKNTFTYWFKNLLWYYFLNIVYLNENIVSMICAYPKLYFRLSSHVVKNQIFFKELFRSLQKLAYGSGMKWIRKKKKIIWNRLYTENFQRNITLCKWYIWRLFEWNQFH